MPGLIAMLSCFVVVTVEQFFAIKGAGHSHGSEWDQIPEGVLRKRRPYQKNTRDEEARSNRHIALQGVRSPAETSNGHVTSPKDRDYDEDDDLDALDPIADESAYLSRPSAHKRHESHEHDDLAPPSAEQNPQKLFLQCLLLEAGILFHSIFIGMAVSVATGTQFVVLLVAICFHQTFEGFALGSRIAALIPTLFDASSPKPWLMCMAYGTTTPVGQLIGLWMHNLYDPASEAGLLMVGITNAISSGLLVFAGLVQLLAEDFLSDRSYEVLKGRRRVEALLAVLLGGTLMAIVGAFA